MTSTGVVSGYLSGASAAGSVGLDIGGGTGALVIATGPEWHGREIEISRKDQEPPVRTRVAVRERRVSGGVRYTAVFPALSAGAYLIWRTATEAAGAVVVAAATVTEVDWWPPP
jgi:hypothetical protein